MEEFHVKLILIYLNDYEDQYQFNEIKELCNLSTSLLKEQLNILKSEGYIEYNGIVLKLTEAGRIYLIDRNLYDVEIDDLFENTVTLEINDKILSPEDIYLPKNFKY